MTFEQMRAWVATAKPTWSLPVSRAEAETMLKERDELVKVLRPFVEAYIRDECAVGDSDLYPEQPRSVHVTLGDCRKARVVFSKVQP